MATASQLQELKDEVTCPICFEYFKEPVIAECGHNFCKSCITYCLEALNAKMPCPLCQRPLREGKLQPNRQVSNMIPVVQQMILKRKKREEEHLCEKHDEKLCLFCHEDQETICVACSQSAEHTDHNVVTIERAAQEYKKTLQSSIEKLKLELENQKTLCAKKEQDVVKMEDSTQIWKEKIRTEIEELQRVMEEEKHHILSSLERQQREILHNIRKNVTELVKQRSSLAASQTEMAGRCQLTDLELLKDIKSILKRNDSLEVQRSKLNSPELEINLQSFKQQYTSLQEAINDLIETLSKDLEWKHSFNFKEKVAAELDWRQVQKYSRVVSLDSSTASRWLNVSEDLRSVIAQTETDIEDAPDRYDDLPCVLGRERLTSGKHYWEVQVGDAKEWKLGVCDETANRRGEITVAPYRGYWAVGREGEDIYVSYTSHSRTPLSPPMPLRTVGIFLDIEARRVAFYNLEQRTLLFCYPRCPLPRTLRPYFCTWDLTRPLLII